MEHNMSDPKKVIFHVGNNNVKNDKPKKMKTKIVNVVETIQAEHPSTERLLPRPSLFSSVCVLCFSTFIAR